MILYHGTDSKNLASIRKNGLLARKFTGIQVYDKNFSSNENFTYLTRWYPVAHAYSANENFPIILKVNVDESDLYPDEDFIERLKFMKTGKASNPTDIDITHYKDLWYQSYTLFGNVAIKQVTPDKIVDHVVLDPSDFEYHCGLGAQGNKMLLDIENQLHFMDGNVVKKYMKRIDMLFMKGWDAVKKDILKERPSLTLSLAKPTEQIRVNGTKLKILLKPNPKLGVSVFVCDEWQENFPIKFPMNDSRFSKLVQVPIDYSSKITSAFL